MERPSDRCGYDHDVPEYFKPYSCYREVEGNGACAWHAPAAGKTAAFLDGARVNLSWGYPEDPRDRWVGRRGERLDGAFLEAADLRTVSFEGCTLAGANLRDADLRGGDLANADLREARLVDARATQCRLDNAVLEGADLSGATLDGANLTNANLRKADLSGASLEDADLSGADLRRATLTGADLQGADLPASRLFRADLSGAELVDADLTGAVLRDATLADALLLSTTFEGASLQSADLTGVNARKAGFEDANLVESRFEGATLDDCEFTDARGRGAVFDDASLERARFDHVELYDASLVGARIYGASFTGTRTNEGTTFGDYVRYDPAYEGDEGGSESPDGDSDDEGDDGNEPVDRLTRAAGSYRILAGLARANEFPELARRYFLRRKAVRRRHHRDRGRWGQWARAVVSGAITGYGERPGRVVGSAVLVALGCGLLYPLGWIRPLDGGDLVWYAPGLDGVAGPLADGIAFSVGTLTTGGVAHEAVGPGRVLAAAESVAGLVLLAALVFVLARRGSR